jgi:DNA-directed RNA polymerase subunit RPC12/RpoP
MNDNLQRCKKCSHIWRQDSLAGRFQCPNCGDPHFLLKPVQKNNSYKINWHFWRVDPDPKDTEHLPNNIPLTERISLVLSAIALFFYGTCGLYKDDIRTPGKVRIPGIHLHGTAALICYFSIIIACCVMLSVVADHYDRRNNERKYKIFARYGTALGWALYTLSLLWQTSHRA